MKISCSRCKKTKAVPDGYKFKLCLDCRAYNQRKKHNLTENQLESIAIKQLGDFDSVYREHKRLCRKMKMKPAPKQVVYADWLQSQKTKIGNIKLLHVKYSRPDAPLVSTDCLKFRQMLAQKGSGQEPDNIELYFNHIPQCDACNRYYAQTKDSLELPVYEKPLTQAQFGKALDGFFSVFQNKDVCPNCGRALMPNGRCPNACEMY